MTAKSAPYPPCTVTAFWLKYQDPARMLRRVTQPPHIAGPLAFSLYPDRERPYSRDLLVAYGALWKNAERCCEIPSYLLSELD
jgi:hypothetical protein